MGKTRDLFKKIRYTKVTLHTEMGTIKDRNGMDLKEAEDIKKKWQLRQDGRFAVSCSPGVKIVISRSRF